MEVMKSSAKKRSQTPGNMDNIVPTQRSRMLQKDPKMLGVKSDLQQNYLCISYLSSDCSRSAGVLSLAGDGDSRYLGDIRYITRRPNNRDISSALYAALTP
jgi:hypothetical protein